MAERRGTLSHRIRVLFYSGDDAWAKADVGTLIDRPGFSATISVRSPSAAVWCNFLVRRL